MASRHLLSFVPILLLSGCALPPGASWPTAEDFPAGRNYVTNPITIQPQQPVQPNFNSFGNQGNDGYQLIMVNTPNGWVQKRCKVLNGQAVACI